MGVGYRTYLHETGDTLRRVSRRLSTDLHKGAAALPEFAGTTQKVVVLEIEFAGRKPQRLLDVQGQIWHFDERGRTADSMKREHCARIELLPGAAFGFMPPGVVDARPEIARRKLDAETRWSVPDEMLHRIAADIRAHG